MRARRHLRIGGLGSVLAHAASQVFLGLWDLVMWSRVYINYILLRIFGALSLFLVIASLLITHFSLADIAENANSIKGKSLSRLAYVSALRDLSSNLHSALVGSPGGTVILRDIDHFKVQSSVFIAGFQRNADAHQEDRGFLLMSGELEVYLSLLERPYSDGGNDRGTSGEAIEAGERLLLSLNALVKEETESLAAELVTQRGFLRISPSEAKVMCDLALVGSFIFMLLFAVDRWLLKIGFFPR